MATSSNVPTDRGIILTRLRHLVDRLRNRADSEHEQALIRLVIVGIVCAYLLSAERPGHTPEGDLLILTRLGAAYFVVSGVTFLAILIRPGISHCRRLIMMLGDFIVLSLFLHIGQGAAAPFYPIYLWVSLGNGFRYGTRYLFASTVTSVAGFAWVLQTTPFWQGEEYLGLGLLAALVGIPAYASTLIRKLTEAVAQAENANRAKSRFLARMSHELRTPLNAIIGMSDVLHATRLDRDQRSMIYTIKTSGRALLGLINNILDLSRIEADKATIVDEDFNLYALIADLLAMFTPQASRKQIRLSAHIEADVPPFVHGDSRYLQQILTNLVGNALKFTEQGHVTIQVQAVTPLASPHPRVRFSVVDSGIGIAPEHHQHIFEQFAQADERMNRHFEGSGLGLAITVNLVNLLNGSIELRSTPNAGSTFIVDIPFEAGSSTAVPAASGEAVVLFSTGTTAISDAVAAAAASRPRLEGCRFAGIATSIEELDRMLALPSGHPTPCVLVDTLTMSTPKPQLSDSLRLGNGNEGPPLIRIATRSTQIEAPSIYLATLSPPITAESLARALYAARLFANKSGEAIEAESEANTMADMALRAARPLNVLVAEDNPVNQKVTRRILEHAGHHVHIVSNGDDALDALDENPFDVFVVDVNMPGMSGLQVVKLYRMAHLGTPPLPIIALTADATPETRRLAEEAGINTFLTKPVEAKRFLDTIDALATTAQPTENPSRESSRRAGRVTQISSHPRYRPEIYPTINWNVIDALRSFADDDDFVYETLQEYAVNSRHLLNAITAAAKAVDPRVFREHVHALRGTSGNVGAEALCRLCQDMHGMSKERLQLQGGELIEQLERELSRFENELSRCAASLSRRTSG